MSILKLAPASVVDEPDKKAISKLVSTDEPLAAASTYLFSANPEYGSIVVSGKQAGISFGQWLTDYGYHALGTDCDQYGKLPLEIRGLGGEEGKLFYSLNKTKPSLWVITEAKPGAVVYLGEGEKTDSAEFLASLADGSFTKEMEDYEVVPQMTAEVDTGTTYVVDDRVRILEVTPTVDLPAELHMHVFDHEEEIEHCDDPDHDHDHDHDHHDHSYHQGDGVIDGSASFSAGESNSLYEADFYLVDGSMEMSTDSRSFKVLVFMSGTAVVDDHEETIHAEKGTVIFAPASSKPFRITGNCNFMMVHLNA